MNWLKRSTVAALLALTTSACLAPTSALAALEELAPLCLSSCVAPSATDQCMACCPGKNSCFGCCSSSGFDPAGINPCNMLCALKWGPLF